MTENMKKLEEENSKLKEGLLGVQCRSMKNNLIFTGLSEQERCELCILSKQYVSSFTKYL
jgi:hypothetical protein